MRIACDASALASPGNGIGRYLNELLVRMVPSGGEWLLYGRGGRPRDPALSTATFRDDGWPRTVGRLLAPFSSQPLLAYKDAPDLYWGPAHRLPVSLPRHTARVVTIHDLCWLRSSDTMRASTRWLDRLMMPRALLQADRVIAVSDATARDLATAFPTVIDSIRVVHEAGSAMPAPAPIEALAGFGITSPFVLVVGTLEPRKNLPRLFEAFSRLSTPAHLVLAGARGWGMEAPESAWRRAGLEGRGTYLGKVDDGLLATLYRHARFLAMPSLYEGFGLPILEALAHGTPVLCGDNSSMPEIAGEAGLAVDATSVEAIAQGLARLLDDDALHAALAARARPQAAKFSWDRAARETLAVFDEALAVRRAKS